MGLKAYTKNINYGSALFFHNIDITVCTKNSGIANGKQGTSSYAGRRMLMNGINVFYSKQSVLQRLKVTIATNSPKMQQDIPYFFKIVKII